MSSEGLIRREYACMFRQRPEANVGARIVYEGAEGGGGGRSADRVGEGVAATEGWRKGEEGAVQRHSGARGVDRQQGGSTAGWWAAESGARGRAAEGGGSRLLLVGRGKEGRMQGKRARRVGARIV